MRRIRKYIHRNKKITNICKYIFIIGMYLFGLFQLKYFNITQTEQIGILFAIIVFLKFVSKK